MVVKEAENMTGVSYFKKSKLSYRSIAQTLPIADNNEPMIAVVPSSTLEVQPFWETPGDLEGELYRSYISKNKDFKLLLRKSLIERLDIASRNLPSNWKLVIKAGYRPLSVQYELLNVVMKQVQVKKPQLSTEEALSHARTFVTDPEIMCPPHCTGAAVDIDVINKITGNCIDMGCPPNTDDEVAFTHYDGLTSIQKQNRKKLLQAMLAAGFANLAYEWWHFSYGDQYWAAFYNHPNALYSIVVE